MSESTTQRRRVTAKDFPKREIKLDVIDKPKAPALPVWYLTPVVLPIALAIFLPSLAFVWIAVAATMLWLGLFALLLVERKRTDFEVGREIVLSFLHIGAVGLALGCWASVIVRVMAG
ncbi:MAG TPA: hypothetical protein PLJ47_03910 [Candidatus Hydrogenedentes bacterium]|nr:hypothetical protein [Candidatus Hydrogenedentota bacterium]